MSPECSDALDLLLSAISAPVDDDEMNEVRQRIIKSSPQPGDADKIRQMAEEIAEKMRAAADLIDRKRE